VESEWRLTGRECGHKSQTEQMSQDLMDVSSDDLKDDRDAEMIYQILENDVIPLYYRVDDKGVPRGWVRVMKEAIKVTGPSFTSRRMVKEYTEKFYRPAMEEGEATRACKGF